MQPGQKSRTAEYMALFRALETAKRERLFADPLASAFLTGGCELSRRLPPFPEAPAGCRR
jgi:O-methyltransferase involved in polyketide biosynthesis